MGQELGRNGVKAVFIFSRLICLIFPRLLTVHSDIMNGLVHFHERPIDVCTSLIQHGTHISKIFIKDLAPVVQVILRDVGYVLEELGADGVKPGPSVVTVHQVVDVGGGGLYAVTVKQVSGRSGRRVA